MIICNQNYRERFTYWLNKTSDATNRYLPTYPLKIEYKIKV